MVILFREFLTFYHFFFFFSPQVKRSVIICNKYGIYKLPNDFTLRIFHMKTRVRPKYPSRGRSYPKHTNPRACISPPAAMLSTLIFAYPYFSNFTIFGCFHKIKYRRNFLLNATRENKYTPNMQKNHISRK